MLGGAAAWENVDSTAGEDFPVTEPVTQPCLLLLIIIFYIYIVSLVCVCGACVGTQKAVFPALGV